MSRSGPRVYVSADMEGVAGVVDREQVDPAGDDYALGRRLMTGEVNAAVEGAFDAGASAVVVSDSHWTKRNLLWERIDPRAEVVSGGPRELGMMAGLDDSFDGAVLLGYHTREGHPKGVLGHTWAHQAVDELRLAGRPAGEGELNAAIAGHFGVPVLLVTGDRWACEEIREAIGDVETAPVKEGLSPSAARSFVPARAREMIRDTTRSAVVNRGRFEPHRLELPVTLEVRFKEVVQATRAARRPDVERLDGKTVRYEGADVVDAFEAFVGMF